MFRVRFAAILGVALLLLAAAWVIGAMAVQLPPVELGTVIVVPAAPAPTSGAPAPTVSERPTAHPTAMISPVVSPSHTATAAKPTVASPRGSEAVPVSKSPAPVAGDDDDAGDNDLDDDADDDDTGDDVDDDDN